jgi:Group II intron, maturase-specific domain
MGCVSLLPRRLFVRLQNLIYERDCRRQLPARPPHFLPRRGQGAANRLPHHTPMYVQFLGDSGNGADAKLVFPADLLEKLHLCSPIQRVPPLGAIAQIKRTRLSRGWAKLTAELGQLRIPKSKGKFFINFSPAVSDKAVKAIRVEIRSWDLHLRSDKRIEDLSRMFNPKIRGWLRYYGRYYRSALYPPMRQLDRSLARWAERKYKKLRGHLRRATHWVARISRRDPKLFAHWQMGVRRGSMVGAV